MEAVVNLFDSPTVRFIKNYVAFTVLGNNYFWFHKRSAKKSLFGFRISDEHLDEVSQLLDKRNISFVQKRNRFKFTRCEICLISIIFPLIFIKLSSIVFPIGCFSLLINFFCDRKVFLKSLGVPVNLERCYS